MTKDNEARKDDALKREWERLEEQDSECAAKIAAAQKKQQRIDKQLRKLEEMWLVRHKCVCELIDVPCEHKKK